MEINEVDEVIKEFTEADNAIRKVFPKVISLLVVKLIFDRKEGRNIFTLWGISSNQGRILKKSRDRIVQVTGMVPSFYLNGTKMVVSHKLDLKLLKRINDLDYGISIKGSPYSAGGFQISKQSLFKLIILNLQVSNRVC